MRTTNTEPEISPIIFDNTVLSNFALAQVLYVLKKLYSGRAFVGKAVQREIQAGIASAYTSTGLSRRTRLREVNQALHEGWLRTPDSKAQPHDEVIELRLSLEYSKRFGAGESEAMAIARQHNWVFASDDGNARQFAKEREIRVTGTLGILVKAAKNQFLSLPVVDEIHSQMIDEGYRSPLTYNNGISNHLKSSCSLGSFGSGSERISPCITVKGKEK